MLGLNGFGAVGAAVVGAGIHSSGATDEKPATQTRQEARRSNLGHACHRPHPDSRSVQIAPSIDHKVLSPRARHGVHTHVSTRTRTHMRAHAHARTRTPTNAFARTYGHACTHDIYAYAAACTIDRALTCTRTHTHTNTHTHTHTHTHTYTAHTHTHTLFAHRAVFTSCGRRWSGVPVKEA